MNLVIVPVDFSDLSLMAADYAVRLLDGRNGVEVLLYHMYEKPDEAENHTENLERIKKDLNAISGVTINILTELGEDFVTELDKLARHRRADLIIMGITGRTGIGKAFMGSNTIKVAENKYCPVLIIPEASEYREIKNVLLTSDLENVVGTTPSTPIKRVLDAFTPQLHILNVNEHHYIEMTEEYEAEKNKLHDMFADYNPLFYFMRLFDIDEAINQFADDKQIDLIISVHKEHSFLERIFKSSHTKKLAYQSKVPLLVVHE